MAPYSFRKAVDCEFHRLIEGKPLIDESATSRGPVSLFAATETGFALVRHLMGLKRNDKR